MRAPRSVATLLAASAVIMLARCTDPNISRAVVEHRLDAATADWSGLLADTLHGDSGQENSIHVADAETVDASEPPPDLAVQSAACPGSINFTNGAGSGLWQAAGNWDQNRLPAAADDVCIPTGFSVVLSSGSHTVASLTVQGTTSLTLSGNPALSIASASSIAGPFTFGGGTLTGAGALTVGGLLTWAGGTMTGAGITNANGGISIGGNFARSLAGGRTLNNAGTAVVVGGLPLLGGAVLNNLPGGSIDLTTAGGFSGFAAGSGTINNAGLVSRTTAAGVFEVQEGVVFNNTAGGNVTVATGELRLAGGGTHAGSFTVGDGATIRLQGVHTLGASASVAGAGTVQVSGGSTSVSGSWSLAGKTLATGGTLEFLTAASTNQLELTGGQFTGGTIGGPATLDISGLFTWTGGGTMTGAGVTNANGGIALSGFFPALAGGRTLNNNGSAVTMSGQTNRITFAGGAVLNNHAGSTVEVQAPALFLIAGTGSGTFNNAGTFHITAGASASTQIPFQNSGNVLVETGSLRITGGTYVQTAGLLLLDDGELFWPNNTFQIQGGVLGGTGTVTALVSTAGGGQVSPGPVPGSGLLTISQTYTVGAAGTLEIEIGGLTAGTQHDRLDLPLGTAVLGGTLNVSLIDGFVPPPGSSFLILTAFSRAGTFATVNLPQLPGGLEWEVIYGPTSVVLSVPGAQQADLGIAMTASADPVDAGDVLIYTLSVTNAGPDAASNVTVSDPLPAGAMVQSAGGDGWTCSIPIFGGTVTCVRPSLALGAAPDITISVLARNAGGTMTNTATVSSFTTDPNAANNSATVQTTVTPVADLNLGKECMPDPVTPGGVLTCTIFVYNIGPSTATALTVTDELPAGMIFQNASGGGWVCANDDGVVTCTRPNLAPDGSANLAITMLAPAGGGTFSNAATITSATADRDLTNNTATATTTVTPPEPTPSAIADLALTKSVSPDPVAAGATLAYTLVVENLGPDAATDLMVTDALPAGVSFQNAAGEGWTCSHASGTVTCARPTLAAGVAPAITIDVLAPAQPGTIANDAAVSSATTDPNASNNSATATTTVTSTTPPPSAEADLSVVKTASPDPVDTGAALTYSIGVSNAGPDAAASVVVTDDLPAGTVFQTASGSGWSCGQSAGTVTCTRQTLGVGAAPVITILVLAPALAGTITNTVVVSAATADADPSNNTASTTTAIRAPHVGGHAGDQGCSPGFWRNHVAAWGPTGYSPGQSIGSVFSGADPYAGHQLLAALRLQGGAGVTGAKQILLRAAVAALLNAAHPGVDHPSTVAARISAVNTALASHDRQTMLALASALDADNNRGCPLN